MATQEFFCAANKLRRNTTKHSGKTGRLAAMLLAFLLVLPSAALAQSNFVYVNNQATTNTVSAYSVSSTGSLTQISGSPFATGGVGANVSCYGLKRIVVSQIDSLLFVANTGDKSITSFKITPSSGALTRVGLVASGLTLDSCQGISLAVTPDGKFLMAASNGQIKTFSIASSGALTLVTTTANCCSPNSSMLISPNGQFLAVSNETSVSMFTIDPTTAALTPVVGSPFPKTGSGNLSGLDFSCAADRLYAGEATGSPALLDAWTVDTTSGALTPVPGTPFASSGNDSNIVLYTPDDTLLFQSNQFTNSINSFHVNSDGTLANVGKFGGTTQVHTPVGMATDATGTFLYVADDAFGVAVFRIGNGGVLAWLSDLAVRSPGEIQDLAAYPSRSCSNADLALTMTAVPDPAPAGAPIQYQLSITNNGPSTSSAIISDTLPPTVTAGGTSPIVNPAGAQRVNTVSGSTVTGNVTITTTVAHQLFTGESVTVGSVPAPTTPNPIQSGSFLTDPGFNGVVKITSVPNPTSFTYLQNLTISQFPAPSLTIASTNGAVRINGTTTITATAPFQLTPGTVMRISGVANTSFNGSFSVLSQPTSTTFTYSQSGLVDASSGGGTATAPNNVPPTDQSGGGNVSNSACLVTSGTGTCSTANFAPHPVIVAGTGASRASNVVTITTAAPHQIFAGQSATISGVADTTFNGTFTVTSVPSPTTFSYTQTGSDAVSGGGSVSVPATAAQLLTFPNLVSGETRSAIITATSKSTLANGTIVGNTANISNKSTVDPVPGNNSATVDITIGSQTGTTLTVPTATGPYGGTAIFTATLKTSAGTPVPNETIGFNFNQNNSNYNAVTDANGVASVVVPLGFTTVGTHAQAFTATFGGDATLGPSSATGDLVVTKAQLTVTADNQSRLYGDPNPPLTYTITGFVNGDTIAVVSGTADCTTTATLTSPVGTYPITCTVGTLSAQNYVFVFVDGTLTVNPAPLTVNVNNATRAYGDPNPTFTGTITGIKNGDNITATYSTTATITSFVGTYPITATLSDNGTGALANYTVTINNGTLTITPAALVVTANNAARFYGDPNPPFSGTIAGIKNNDPITAIYTTTATPTSPVGTYPIIPTLSDNGSGTLVNYTVTVNNGSLTVSPAPLTVTAANATMPYGGPLPVLTGTITGIKNNDNITATYSTTATVTSPVGTYPIVPTVSDNGTGVLSNYSVTLVNGTLTVTQAILTVNVNNASMIYGDPLPVFSGTITGIKNGDNITATYSTTATSASPVGTYPITATLSDNGTGALANYAVVINNGVLTINPAPLTVTAANASMIYGDPLPVFTGSIVGIKNGDAISATFSTTATSASSVGTYPIVPTLIDPTNKLSNYTVTSINGTLTINPAPLTVTADNASKLFGTVNPPLNGVITGIKNSDPITATYATTAVATSPVGTYPIIPTLVDPAGKLGNYTVTSNNGTLTVNAAPTANFVFVNNQGSSANTINGYSVAVDGTLTALAGSPVSTGGLGANAACPSINRLALSAGNNLLFVSNGGDQTISAFTIDPASGTLTAAAGSPFASGLTLDACNGISLAATPDGQFLMASSNGQIKTFGIGAGGVLTALSTASNPVVPNSSLKVSANGQFLAVSNGTSVSIYTINGDGSLSAVAGSPFAETGTATLAGLDFSSTSSSLFAAEASATSSLADAWTVAANGALSAVAGSPFTVGAINSNVVLLSPDNSLLFASNQGSANVTSFSVAASGALSSVGSFGTLHAPVGMATDRSGSLLYVADDAFGVGVFRISQTSLAQLSDTAISGAGQVQDLVAYPPRMASNADLGVAISASSPNVVAGQNVSFTITVTNNGADPAAATVTDSLPSGFSVVSCSATGNGACIGNTGAASFYLLQSGESQTITLVASTSLSIPDGTVAINTVSITNSSAVDPNPANNSASVNVTVAQPITTTLTVAAASGTYGGSTTLSATLKDAANNPVSGKTINFSLNGTAAGSAVTDATGLASVTASLVGINAGLYTGGLTASFAGDPNTKAANGSADLTVNPALLTVTASNASRVYGDPNPVFAFTITGFVNGETSSVLSGSPSCTTTATQASAVGTYPITCTQGTLSAQNYTFTFVSGTLTITQAPLTVTADNFTRFYGDPNPTFTGIITGIKNGDNISAVYATTATQTSPVGTYAITVGLVDPTNKLSNYSVTVNNGVLTVNPAPLTVTAANASMTYGSAVPALSGTITGIKNGDNITATYSTTATSTSAVGTYAIVPTVSDNGTGALANYAVTVNNGTLTITQATLTVTAANASMVYGDPLPLLTGTITGIQNGDNITATYSTSATSASAVGTYAIVATVSDNGTGKLANYTVVINNGVLAINPAPLSVTTANASMIYGDPVPALTGSISGIKNGDNITATFSTTATSASPVGTYASVPTLVDPTNKLSNYTVTSSNGILTINPAPLTVTADNASRLFGTPNPPFTGTITGIKNTDPITATYTTTATASSPVGTYPITPVLSDNATGKLGNYTVTSNNGTLTVNAAPTTNFVFVNNQASTGNSINGYSVAVDGTLTALAGSPVGTGGLGANAACSSVNRMALSAGNNLLFVSNGGDQTISAFAIDPASGALTAVVGSPSASGLTLDACSGISLSATPDGRFLMASSNGQIKTFSIGAGGVLTALSTASNPVVPNASMKISANGQFLAVSNGTSVSVYTINPDGSLTAVAGSPFAETGTATLAGLDFSSTSSLLFGAEASATSSLADAWTVGASGALSAVAGSPFSIGAVNSSIALRNPDNSLLFASNQGSANVTSFSVAASGALSSIGSFGTLHAPVGMATDRSGSLLYVADDSFGVGVFRISQTSLAQLSDTAISGAGQVQDLVAYPPRMASNADLGLAISASSPNVVAGQNVSFTITVTNNGPDPAAATVTNTLPSGFTLVSCSATGNGACIGNTGAASFYLLQSGESQTVTLVASTSLSIADGTVATDSVSITNSSAVDPNAANNSASANVTVGQPATTTLAVAPASGTYGGSTTLSATLSTTNGALSGQTVSFSLSGTPVGSAVTNASGVATLVTPLGSISAGSHPGAITASFAGDPNNKASTGSGNLTVNPAPLTVTAANASRAYGDPNPAFTGTVTGIQNGDNITASYSTTATATSGVGTYPIVPALSDNGSGALANYTVTSSNGTLTVNPALLTVAAANASMVYGDPVPALTGTITGIKNGENITASYSTTASSTSNVGTYPIVPAVSDNGTGALVNYTVALNNGTLTINPAPLTVTAANASMVYGDPLPALSGTVTGIKNADNITATYSTTATSASPVGTYPIVPAPSDNGTGKLANYTVALVNGTLTINPAPLTVTAANASMTYGDPLPAFSGTITGIRNADNITASYTTTATSASPVGTYPITPVPSDNGTGKLANYTVTLVNGTLTINPAPLTATAANASMIYGDPLPAFSGTITGVKNADNITAVYTTTATSASNVGTYPIVPALSDNGTGALANYTVTLVNATLTINPAPLTVSAANASMFYGDPVPVLTGTVTGTRNGDNITGIYTTTATSTSPVGSYPITATASDNGTGKLTNYTVTLVNATLTINPAPLTVTANNSSMVFGDPVPSLSGTITGIKNGNNITATYSTTATSTSPVGTYPIVPTVSDNGTGALANYAVTLVNGTLTINPAPLTVTATSTSMIYGDPVPAVTGTLTGVKNGDNITASFSTTATSASPVGPVPIVGAVSDNGTGALANYTVTFVNGTLTINPAPLTVTAANASMLYGDPVPALTGTITGIKNNDNIGATFSTPATSTSPVGNYAIIPTLVDPTNKLSNYTVTVNNGVLSITPAPLSVTAANASMIYGDPVPALTGTITGIRNTDNITATYSTTATSTSTAGNYPIVPALSDNGTGALANYVVTSNNGTLTINPAPLTIQANDATAPVGGPFPTFTGVITGIKNNDNITASYTTTADATSPAGQYPIIPSADPNPLLVNYTVTLINGTLTLQ